ncbi:MAG: DUF3291 domain-containing protein [Cyclobacteriaceae bacterium]|jgi:hypothetical protein|nr:DUF3291 domain-containing protein [Flammeovirgaceae bacterium]
MIVVVTSIQLKTLGHLFPFVRLTGRSVRQLKKVYPHVIFKASGFWKTYYTLSGWKDAVEMKQYATSGAHLEAMKSSSKVAARIQTITFESTDIPSWKEAKEKLATGKVITYR